MAPRIGVYFTTEPHGGGSFQWTLNLLHALHDHAEKNRLPVVVFHRSNHPEISTLQRLFPLFTYSAIGKAERSWAGVVRRLAFYFPVAIPALRRVFPLNFRAAANDVALMLFPNTTLDSSLYRKRHVFFLCDIAHVFYPYFPEVSANGELTWRDRIFRHGLKNADVIVVESEQLGRDIAKYYGADPRKVAVLYQVLPRAFQSDVAAARDENIPLPARYLFYPAQLWQHKNHKNLLAAMPRVLAKVPDLHLVLSGSRKEGDKAIFDLIDELHLQDHVHYLGYVSDGLMARLYKNAEALVMPTFFGPSNIPTLEAFYFGCPAIISDLPGVVEQTGDAALRFDPTSADAMADAILTVISDPSLRADLIRRGRERTAVLTYDYLRDTFSTILERAWTSGRTSQLS
jgi:glycosyltransferase involved in cell wall biosynthesis